MALAAEASDGWARIDLVIQATVPVQLTTVEVHSVDGTPLSLELPKVVTVDLLRARQRMYEPGRGTWFSASLTVFPDGGHQAEFNFDDDPGWDPPLHPVAFARDLEFFPRDGEHVPPWLAEQLRLAEVAEAEHQAQSAPPSA
ncbi:hypothetical protein APASM_2609 [Actinosynnema pretiosum subsp. pretiosum]|nr:hypothetical protein APASM_2609 [Actinosynnema pretiosum subsp. pretiosum]